MSDLHSTLVLFYLLPLLSLTWLVNAIKHIYELGRSITRRRKDKAEMTFMKRLLLSGYVERCKYHRKTAGFFQKIYLVYIAITIAASLLLLLHLLFPGIWPLAAVLVYGRIFLMDVVINLSFFFCFTNYRKDGRITMKWTKNE